MRFSLETTRAAGRAMLISLMTASLSCLHAQQPSASSILAMVDDAVRLRVDNVASFTDVEHYAVYRGNDEKHPVAQMVVRDSYTKGKGKNYTMLSQSGSALVMKFGLRPLLENETAINQPDKVAQSWITTANYAMTVQPGIQTLSGRRCYAIAIKPRQKAPNMIDGTIWVDAKDGTLMKVDGVASKSPSPFAGTTHMMREYRNIDGHSMATYARAESKSLIFGRTVVVIRYGDYQLKLRGAGVASH